MEQKRFPGSHLRLVAAAPAPDNPPLAIGEFCRLNSGGPKMLIVDGCGSKLVAAWKDQDGDVHEAWITREIVRRTHANG